MLDMTIIYFCPDYLRKHLVMFLNALPWVVDSTSGSSVSAVVGGVFTFAVVPCFITCCFGGIVCITTCGWDCTGGIVCISTWCRDCSGGIVGMKTCCWDCTDGGNVCTITVGRGLMGCTGGCLVGL